MNAQDNQFNDTALVGISRTKIRALSEFDSKLHSVPKTFDERSSQFIGKLASAEVENDVESIFKKLRKGFKLKRVDAKVSTPDPGWGTIETPYFVYSINATLDEEDASCVRWERSVREIADPDQVGSTEFASIFDCVFDRIEFNFEHPIQMEDWIDNIEEQDDDRLELDYDSGLQNCSLKIDGVAATIHVCETKFAVVHPQPATTKQILTSYLEASQTVTNGFAKA